MNTTPVISLVMLLFLALACPLQEQSGPDAKSSPGQKALASAWQKFAPDQTGQNPEPVRTLPGRVVGPDPELDRFYPTADWNGRAITYELYFASATELARTVYDLAIQAGDLSPDISLERFERGAQGFHYNCAQLTAWADSVRSGQSGLTTPESRALLDELFAHGILATQHGQTTCPGPITHLMGAAAGKKRSFQLNLNHERLHILWDQDQDFRTQAQRRWHNLTAQEKEQARAALPGYSSVSDEQFIEEWAVRQAEATPVK